MLDLLTNWRREGSAWHATQGPFGDPAGTKKGQKRGVLVPRRQVTNYAVISNGWWATFQAAHEHTAHGGCAACSRVIGESRVRSRCVPRVISDYLEFIFECSLL